MTLLSTYIHSRLAYDPNSPSGLRWVNRNNGIAGSLSSKRYWNVAITIDGRTRKIKAHRIVWFLFYDRWPHEQLDHINHIKSDNRIENLRECTQAQNSANSVLQKRNKSGFKGVIKDRNKWKAMIGFNGKQIYLGLFKTPEEASSVYQKKAKELYGEFSNAL